MNRTLNETNLNPTVPISKKLRINLLRKVAKCLILLSLASSCYVANAQQLSKEKITKIQDFLNSYAKKEQKLSIGKIKVDSTNIDYKRRWVKIFANENGSYLSFTNQSINSIYNEIKEILRDEFPKYSITLYADGLSIDKYNSSEQKEHFTNKKTTPLVSPSRNYSINKGLTNRHIALWQSHGWYFEQKLDRWEWQRARIFQTVEDLYTQSYVLPFLVPMLENAGANVLLPRERDFQKHEIIVDNDGCLDNSKFSEYGSWEIASDKGFAHKKTIYKDFENPFSDGTYKYTKSRNIKDRFSFVEWIPEIPESGKYAIYISYKSLKNSTEDARYEVHHKGGISHFSVNQKMGGGTWIYLGHFEFDKGLSDNGKVMLSSASSKTGRIITADAVKFGGGIGNIARIVGDKVTENVKSSEADIQSIKESMPIEYQYKTSTYPRYREAARYWMQWAGIPDSVYSPKQGANDYIDDYQSRGLWVNYLAGGSSVAPKKKGLKIPIDLAFAFHSDAGTTMNDSIIGTLGIYYAPKDEKFENGITKQLSHSLTDIIQTEIVNDIRAEFEPNWSRRGKWNKEYSEAKTPQVPTMLLELLSHQNFADMRYGLDPRFKFTVSRAIYKGMLKHLAQQYNQEYIVQPLPVNNMSLDFISQNDIELKWQPVVDSTETTAQPSRYIVYTRIDDGAFDLGKVVENNNFRTSIETGKRYSFKVAALNEGGKSFDSEILSIYQAPNSKGTVLIINGFDRISAPGNFNSGERAGFDSQFDNGVPYLYDASFIGKQKEFRRAIPWMDDDASGFGDSFANFETKVIVGNTFDYPDLHGKSIAAANYSYVSASNEAIENNQIELSNYKIIDYILGLQKETKIGTSPYQDQFKIFTKTMQEKIKNYCNAGGNIFVSGAYLGTDIWDNGVQNEDNKKFAQEVLKYKWRARQAATDGKIVSVSSPFGFDSEFEYYNQLNEDSYAVESPDAIEPALNNILTIFRYRENNLSMGIAYADKYKTCILAVPFESIKTKNQRNKLMLNILNFFDNNNN